MNLVFAHILEGKGTMEILANIATNILGEHESTTWVIEEVLLHVYDKVIDDSDLMARLDHLHELSVRDLGWWSFEWYLLSPVELMPDFKEKE